MLTTIYLGINAVMYLIFGVWCAIAPESTSQAVGLSYTGMKGFAEYTAVYGGLEFGIGVFYLLSLLRPGLQSPAILFSVCLYVGISVFRTAAILRNGSGIENGWFFYGAEVMLAVISLFIFTKQ